MRKINTLFIFLAFFIFSFAAQAQAEDFFSLQKAAPTPVSDWVLSSPNGEVAFKMAAGTAADGLIVKMMQLAPQDSIGNFFTYPADLTPASDLYFIELNQTSFLSDSRPMVALKYNKDDRYKELYRYNWEKLIFERMATERDGVNGTLAFVWPMTEKDRVIFALFDEPETIGRASWYVHAKYRNELIAASRDFAIDSKIKVKNLYNDKEVVVTVKDFGPKKCSEWTAEEQKQMGPCQERILDLSKTAFLKLATTTGVGIISQVKVTPVDN